jgi:predicted SnoaL-like aldol condensation-catalyzing enzyme
MKRIAIATMFALLALAPAFGKEHSAEKNKAIVRRVFTEILPRGKFEIVDEIYANDYVNHGTTKDLGLNESSVNDHGWRAAFPDLEMTVEKEIAEGDLVTVM